MTKESSSRIPDTNRVVRGLRFNRGTVASSFGSDLNQRGLRATKDSIPKPKPPLPIDCDCDCDCDC